jgi:hydrogenase maturation factor
VAYAHINDLAVAGALPLYSPLLLLLMMVSNRKNLKTIAVKAGACQEAGVKIVTGDTRCDRGKCDGVFITRQASACTPRNRENRTCRRVSPAIY